MLRRAELPYFSSIVSYFNDDFASVLRVPWGGLRCKAHDPQIPWPLGWVIEMDSAHRRDSGYGKPLVLNKLECQSTGLFFGHFFTSWG